MTGPTIYHDAVHDDVLPHPQGPQGRVMPRQRNTITARLPLKANRRPRYRIKTRSEKVERVVTEGQISQVG